MTRRCPICDKDMTFAHHNAVVCSKTCQTEMSRLKRAEKVRLESIEEFKDAPTSSYAVCKICGYCAVDLSNHIMKIHKMKVDDYKAQFNVKVVKSQDECDKRKGDKNPAYQHGGKFSPFSKNFIHNDGSEEHEVKRKETQKKAYDNSFGISGKRRTHVDYWMAKGMTLAEAKEHIADMQANFSLKKCIAKHGLEKGQAVWQARQDKWLATLNSKSDEEKADINRRKVSLSLPLLWRAQYEGVDGEFYILLLTDNTIKIGLTTLGLRKRYADERHLISKVLVLCEMTVQKAFMIEQVIKKILHENRVEKVNCCLKDGYTENFNVTVDCIMEQYNDLLEADKLYEKFISFYPNAIKYNFDRFC